MLKLISKLRGPQMEDKKNVLTIVSEDGWQLESFDEFADDEDVVLAAVNNSGSALQFASDRLKNDKKIVIAAVSNDPYSISFASDELQSDDDVLDACEETDE